jgi:hypothetical protein
MVNQHPVAATSSVAPSRTAPERKICRPSRLADRASMRRVRSTGVGRRNSISRRSGVTEARARDAYGELRGVEWVGTTRIVEDWDTLWQIGCSVFSRYFGPVTDENRAQVERTLNKRVGILFDVERVVSWDHRKLGVAP